MWYRSVSTARIMRELRGKHCLTSFLRAGLASVELQALKYGFSLYKDKWEMFLVKLLWETEGQLHPLVDVHLP